LSRYPDSKAGAGLSMLNIMDFSTEHIERAGIIAKKNFDNERKSVPILPPADKLPDFSPFVKNGLGVSAFDGEEMLGYLCCFGPFKNAFGTTNDTGIYSPFMETV